MSLKHLGQHPLLLVAPMLALVLVESGAHAQAAPRGGQPAPGAVQSVPDLEAQVAYQRAFEATVWAMPASAIYRFRKGFFELPGVADNVIVSYSTPLKTIQEAITPNTVTPYIVAFSDLKSGPVVLEVPAKTEKASLYG